MEGFDAGGVRVHLQFLVGSPVEGGADFDVFLREVVGVDEDFADLVGVFGILAVVGVVALFEETGVAALDGGDGVGLDFVHDAEDLPNLDVERGLGAEEDVAVGVGGFVAVVHQLGVGADLAVVAGDELEEAQHRALGHDAEGEGRGGGEQPLLHVLAKADQPFLEILRHALLDLVRQDKTGVSSNMKGDCHVN